MLAAVQGLAEFLPISSSGHLVLCQQFLGVNAPGMRLDVMLHLGTLVSIGLFYRQRLVAMAVNREWRYLLKLGLSALPAVGVYFCFKRYIEDGFENPLVVSGLLVFTGVVLVATRYLPQGASPVGWLKALWMGVGQALALLPGISRSGMTLAFARAGGVDSRKSAEFSFLMSAPLIAGAVLLELLKSGETAAAGEPSWAMTAVGAAIAAVVGYAALSWLVRTLVSRRFWLFGVYCVLMGLAGLTVGLFAR